MRIMNWSYYNAPIYLIHNVLWISKVQNFRIKLCKYCIIWLLQLWIFSQTEFWTTIVNFVTCGNLNYACIYITIVTFVTCGNLNYACIYCHMQNFELCMLIISHIEQFTQYKVWLVCLINQETNYLSNVYKYWHIINFKL